MSEAYTQFALIINTAATAVLLGKGIYDASRKDKSSTVELLLGGASALSAGAAYLSLKEIRANKQTLNGNSGDTVVTTNTTLGRYLGPRS